MKGVNFLALLFLSTTIHSQSFPESFYVFRETVYAQNTAPPELTRLYTEAEQDVERECTGTFLYLTLSHCEYLMGLSYWVRGEKDKAAVFYERGIARANESLAQRQTSEGYRILGMNISLLCAVRRTYGLANHRSIEENAKKALELDPQNLMARYLIAAKQVTAPWPFGNARRGLSMLEEITGQNIETMEKENIFYLYMMMELACLKLDKNQDARIWHEKAVSLYPTDTIIDILLKRKK
jgi:tetratricopeptide (TPR) repeat protein